jgi:hypothetical protein
MSPRQRRGTSGRKGATARLEKSLKPSTDHKSVMRIT